MKITISNKKLKKSVAKGKLQQDYGKNMADKIKLRLDHLTVSTSLEDMRYLGGNCHELTSNRKGQWACDLVGKNRLIFIPHETPIPTDKDGKYIWLEILGVEIIEIVDYH